GFLQGPEREVSIANELQNSHLDFGSKCRNKLRHQFERMLEYRNRIPVSDSRRSIFGSKDQVADRTPVVVSFLEVQGKFSRQFRFAGDAKRLEPLPQNLVQLGPAHLGESAIQDFPIQ